MPPTCTRRQWTQGGGRAHGGAASTPSNLRQPHQRGLQSGPFSGPFEAAPTVHGNELHYARAHGGRRRGSVCPACALSPERHAACRPLRARAMRRAPGRAQQNQYSGCRTWKQGQAALPVCIPAPALHPPACAGVKARGRRRCPASRPLFRVKAAPETREQGRPKKYARPAASESVQMGQGGGAGKGNKILAADVCCQTGRSSRAGGGRAGAPAPTQADPCVQLRPYLARAPARARSAQAV